MNISSILSLPLKDFGLSATDFEALNDKTIVVTKWNWDYHAAHQFQRAALELVHSSTGLRILVCTSHPEVLTNGRGLQKPRKGESLELVEFKKSDYPALPFPFYQIERGGGLTFHHPGQFIFYPIVKLNPAGLSLSKMIEEIFDFSIDVLKSWGVSELNHENKLLGLWHGPSAKVASMGIAIEKLVTFHGMALNLKKNENMMTALRNLNPCGLSVDTYVAVEELTELPENSLECFRQQFLERIRDEWK